MNKMSDSEYLKNIQANPHLVHFEYPTTRKQWQREYVDLVMKTKKVNCLSPCCGAFDVEDPIDATTFTLKLRWAWMGLFLCTLIGEVIIIVLEATELQVVEMIGIVMACKVL